ncbi:MAG TPA: lipopolysaccharide transport periplasmic protein LptA [Burkholderiales bacterium]|nr:lipopolysaccharide transport periplasmic protein LptA [Burkholderiales bacterium]
MRIQSKPRSLPLWALLGVLFCAPAAAERADRDKPVNVEADKVNVDDANKVSTFEGNVVLTQGTIRIRADKMIVRQNEDGFNSGTAYGNLATFRQKMEGVDKFIEGEAERIEYDGKAEKLELFTRAHVKRGQDELRGNYISYNAQTEFYQALSGKPATASETKPGRVRAVIQPKDKNNKPDTPASPATLKPSSGIVNPPQE